MAIPLDDAFIRAYVGRSLEIDCPRVVLREGKIESPQVFEGPGFIAQDEAGAFWLRMYPKEVDESLAVRRLFMNPTTPGVLLAPEAFYALDAVDVKGHRWSCPRVRPRMTFGPGGAVIRAEVDRLLSVRSSTGSSHWLRLVFPEHLKLAWNRSTQTLLKAGDRKLRENIERSRAEFTVGDLSFEIQRDDVDPARTTVVARSTKPLPTGIEWRVQEALRFLLFCSVSWGIAESGAAGEHRIQIVAPQATRSTLLNPPLQPVDPQEDYWRLFGAYLNHACKHQDPSTFHPLSGQLNAILDVESPHLEILALLLGISVEGVLKCEFGDVAPPPEEFLAELVEAPALIDAMGCSVRLKERLRGALGPMSRTGAKDKLYALRARGVLSESSIRAWERLRHEAAHATHLDPLKHQDHLNRCYQVYELLLRLTFVAIGYKGVYRQYATEHWPLGKFPPEPDI